MRIRKIIIVVIAVLAVNTLFAQVSTNNGAEKKINTIEMNQPNRFENQIKTYIGYDNQTLFVENQTKEAVTVQVLNFDGKMSFLKASKDQLVSIPMSELYKGIAELEVFDVHGNTVTRKLVIR